MDSEKTDSGAVLETEYNWLWALISSGCIYNTPTTPKAQKSGRKDGESRRARISAVRWCLLYVRRKETTPMSYTSQKQDSPCHPGEVVEAS